MLRGFFFTHCKIEKSDAIADVPEYTVERSRQNSWRCLNLALNKIQAVLYFLSCLDASLDAQFKASRAAVEL